jgi:Gas vesicle protein G
VGLITGLLTLPLAPVRGLGWLAEQVQELADQEYEQRMGLQARLAEIERATAAGEISAEEAVADQERVLDEYWVPRGGTGEDGRDGS